VDATGEGIVTCLALYLHPDPVLRRGLVDGSVGQVVLKRRTCEECGGDGYFDQVDSRTTPQQVADLTCDACEGRGWLPALVPESATPTEVREVGSPDLGWQAFEGDDETWSSLDLSDDFRCRTSPVPGRLGIVEEQARWWSMLNGWHAWMVENATNPLLGLFKHQTRQVVSVVRPVMAQLPVVDGRGGENVISPWGGGSYTERPGNWVCPGPHTHVVDLPLADDLQPGDVVLVLGEPEPLAEPITQMVGRSGWSSTVGDWIEPVPLAVEASSVEEVETP
jgi:hypothetical protein